MKHYKFSKDSKEYAINTRDNSRIKVFDYSELCEDEWEDVSDNLVDKKIKHVSEFLLVNKRRGIYNVERAMRIINDVAGYGVFKPASIIRGDGRVLSCLYITYDAEAEKKAWGL